MDRVYAATRMDFLFRLRNVNKKWEKTTGVRVTPMHDMRIQNNAISSDLAVENL
jgi:hypothetical protein